MLALLGIDMLARTVCTAHVLYMRSIQWWGYVLHMQLCLCVYVCMYSCMHANAWCSYTTRSAQASGAGDKGRIDERLRPLTTPRLSVLTYVLYVYAARGVTLQTTN